MNTTFEEKKIPMKLVKNCVLAVLLASCLAVTAFAGDQATPGFAAPTPTPPPDSIRVLDGEIGACDPCDGNTETSDYLFFEALAALLSVY